MAQRISKYMHSLRFQAIASIILIMIVPSLIMAIITSNLFVNSTKRNVEQYSDVILEQLCGNIDIYMMDMVSVGVKISENTDVQRTLKYAYLPYSDRDYYAIQEKMISFLSGLSFVRADITGIYIYNSNQIVYYKNGQQVFTRPILSLGRFDIFDQNWYESLASSKDNSVILAPGYVRMSGLSLEDQFSVAEKVIDIDSERVVGYLLITMNVEKIQSLCDTVLMEDQVGICVYDGNGKIVYNSSKADVDSLESYFEQTGGLDISGLQNPKLGSESFHVIAQKAPYSKWHVMLFYDESYINRMSNRYNLINLIGILLTASLSVTVLLVLIRRIISPLSELEVRMRLLEEGDFNVRMLTHRKDEIGKLSASFNTMAEQLGILVNEVFTSRLQVRNAELKALQSQINPHFLYNTLASIQMMAEINDDAETAKMLSALGKYYRYCTKTESRFATVKEEIDFVSDYITFQKIRVPGVFRFYIFAEEGVLDSKIPKLCIQPIVENCIVHGHVGQKKDALVLLSIQAYAHMLQISVADNGLGIEEARLRCLNERLHEKPAVDQVADESSPGSGIGLPNINDRIKSLYGEEWGLQVFSIHGEGTEVVLTIPLAQPEQEGE
ncbi:MAG: sensor histidine kinase [Clostridiales Family XIII bacterium]|jgi:two-component system sensor histidine kinase YesM|nr:sensor histidine kinase [Clostridiales Family XIII bacterium]